MIEYTKTKINHFALVEEQFMEGINDLSDTEISAIQEFLEEQPDFRYRFKEPFVVYACGNRLAMRCDGINLERDTYRVNVEVIDSPNEIVFDELNIYELEYMSINQICLQLSLELPD